jgi:hypothetical protein
VNKFNRFNSTRYEQSVVFITNYNTLVIRTSDEEILEKYATSANAVFCKSKRTAPKKVYVYSNCIYANVNVAKVTSLVTESRRLGYHRHL